MQNRKATFSSAASAMLLLGAVSCGSPQEAEMGNTITIQEANQRLESYIQQAKSALPASAGLVLRGQSKEAPCDDPSDKGAKGRLVADRSYQLTGVAAKDISEYFDTLRTWSQNNNYQVLQEKQNPQYLWLEKRDDGFRLALDSNESGELYLNGSSPCVWRNGTPEPTS
ncbi:hypothetical protein ACIQUM_00630 [Amycolatopsis azurea]|uniref:hypothetical protein n=1 Tax=Amycolatopsis azurea TaxID=36819 RepID=UPI0037FDB530